jgi:hypothetical protein
MVKHILLTGVALAAVAGLSGAAVRHYDEYKKTQAPVETTVQKVDAAVVSVQKSWSTKYAQLTDAYTGMQSQCVKGANAYAALPATQKAKLPAPVCK